MRWTLGPILTCAALLAAGCATDDRQWMKLSDKYTTGDFRRDHADCSKSGKLDDGCMRGRGWVAVSPAGKSETPKDPYAREIGAPATRPRGTLPGGGY
jgi:hypothetical protein